MVQVVFEEIRKRVPMTEDDWSGIEPLFTFLTIKKEEGDFVMVHSRYTGLDPKPLIAVDIFRSVSRQP